MDRTMTPVIVALFIALVMGAAKGQESPLTAKLESEHFSVFYRPGSRAGAEVERTSDLAERDLVLISECLGIKPAGRYRVFLYDDVDELTRVTGVGGTAGFSAGDASHVPVGNDQTLFHELVHIIAFARLPKSGDEERSLFFAEGLANACLRFVHGVPVHAVAKYYRKRGALPPLSELTGGDFYGWLQQHPGFNAYDVAASYILFLMDTYGPKKTTLYYGGATPKRAFGATEKTLEKRWHEALDAFVLRPEVEQLLDERHGAGAAAMTAPREKLGPDLLGKPSDWTAIAKASLHPENDAAWSWSRGVLEGTSEKGEWSICELGEKTYGDCAVRARIATSGPTPIQVRLGRGNQAMLVNGTFVYRGDAPVASSPRPAMKGGEKETDFLVVRRSGMLEVWIDGEKALETPADPAPTRVGVAFHQGTVRFSEIAVRELP